MEPEGLPPAAETSERHGSACSWLPLGFLWFVTSSSFEVDKGNPPMASPPWAWPSLPRPRVPPSASTHSVPTGQARRSPPSSQQCAEDAG